MKNSFVIYTDIKETLDALSDADVAALFRGMVDYQVTGEAPDFSGVLKVAFIPIRQQMDRDAEKWEKIRETRVVSGRLGGIASGESRRRTAEANASESKQTKQNEANEAVNVNVNANVNVNDNVTVREDAQTADAVIPSLFSYLNSKTGGSFRPSKEVTARIAELLAAGYTEADMRTVIDRKAAEWGDNDKMKQYLRPRTLFGEKFPEYAAAPEPEATVKAKKRAARKERLREERDQKARTLAEIMEELERIRGKPGGIKGNYEEYHEVDEKRIVLAQEVDNLDRQISA